MKTTLQIDDEVWGRARMDALVKGLPVGRVVEAALRAYLPKIDSPSPVLQKLIRGGQPAGKSGVPSAGVEEPAAPNPQPAICPVCTCPKGRLLPTCRLPATCSCHGVPMVKGKP